MTLALPLQNTRASTFLLGVLMKRTVASILLFSMLAINPYHQVFAKSLVQNETKLESIFNEFKKKVYVEGEKSEKATEVLVEKILNEKITTGDLQLYIATNSNQEEFNRFNQMLETSLAGVENLSDLPASELSFILKQSLAQTTSTGANFMSCSAGLGVGVPLIAIGVILGLTALANATASKEVVTQQYLEDKQALTTDYYNLIADLAFETATYEADIIYYQDEIDELNRRINSGMYSQNEVENMHKLIRDYTFKITDATALIAEVKVDVDYFHQKYALDIKTMETKEVSALNEVSDKHRRSGKQAMVAGIMGGVGTIFTAIGSRDCN
jgi:hypothetical protein